MEREKNSQKRTSACYILKLWGKMPFQEVLHLFGLFNALFHYFILLLSSKIIIVLTNIMSMAIKELTCVVIDHYFGTKREGLSSDKYFSQQHSLHT
jgi:hypothetical protein